MKKRLSFLALAFFLVFSVTQTFGALSFNEDWNDSILGDIIGGYDSYVQSYIKGASSYTWLATWIPGCTSVSVQEAQVIACVPRETELHNGYASASIVIYSCWNRPGTRLPLIPVNQDTTISFDVAGETDDPNACVFLSVGINLGTCPTGVRMLQYIISGSPGQNCSYVVTGSGEWERNLYQDLVSAWSKCGLDFESWRYHNNPSGDVYVSIVGFAARTGGTSGALGELGTISITSEMPPSEMPPVASFTYSPEKPMVGGRIKFDASKSPGNIVDYRWDFGDGELGSGIKIQHIFKEPKIYDVKLTVTDADGLTDSNSVELNLTLENGDLLICRDKDSFFGNLGINFWTHVGIYHKQSNMVIEARGFPDLVVAFYPLSDWFFPHKTYVEVLRVEKTSQAVRNSAVDFAFAQIGKPYDLFTLLINGTKNKDDSYGLGWYCSELVWAAYLNASSGVIDFDPDMLAVSPDEIYLSEHTKSWATHLENEPSVVWSKYFCGWAKCPVDLEITDPDGLVLNKQGSEIPEAMYQEVDINGDDDLDDFFAIPEPKEGIYLIHVIPEADASPNDTFTLVVNRDVTTKVLAQDVQVQDIPAFPFVVTTLTSLSADMEIEPETLSLSSEGNWITCYIQFPEAYYIANIDSSTILLNGEIPPAWLFAGDEEDIEQILMVKFDRSDLQKIIQLGNVELIVTGELLDGTPFECRDTIRVIE